MLRELLAEHPRIHARRLRQERRAEAGRERRLRLGDADLGAGELRGEARQEVEERLLVREPRDRRQHAECVRGEHHDGARMAGALLGERVRDALELVRGPRVLGLRRVVEVEHAALVDGDVLEDRAERARRLEDLRLGLLREPDHLRVAAAFDVEDAAVAPAVLVVADQPAARDPRRASSCPFPRGRRTRRRGRRRPTLAEQCIGRMPSSGRRSFITVKIDFLISPAYSVPPISTSVRAGCSATNVPLRVPSSSGSASSAGACRTSASASNVSSSSSRRLDEDRLREQRVIRAVGDHAHPDPLRGICAGERVDDVQHRLHVQVRDDLVAEPEELLLFERLVDVSPPDAVLGAALPDDELVLRRAPRVDAGVDDERPALGEHALLARERVRVEHRGGRISVECGPSA